MKKQYIFIILNLLGIISSVYLNQYLGIILIILSIVACKELIIANLVITPFFETAVIITDGITITTVLYLFVLVLCMINLFFKKNNKIILLDFLFAFFILLIFSTIGVYNAYIYGTINEFNFLKLIVYYLPRIVLFFLLTNFLINQSENFFENSTKYLSLFLIFIVPMLCIYFQNNSTEINWHNKATRTILNTTDPNELSVILISFFPFIFLSKSLKIIFKIFFSIFSLYLIFQLASRTSIFLLFSFMILFPIYYYKKSFQRLSFIFLISLLFTFSLEFIIQQNFDIINRIVLNDNINNATGGRSSLYIGSFNAFIDNPIFGYGANNNLASEINFKYSGIRLVSHNIILEFLMSFGLIGVISISILYFNNKKIFKISNTYLANTYRFALFILLVGAFTLSWFWREILWIIFSIYFALNYIQYKKALK